jgi:hypothetical protein
LDRRGKDARRADRINIIQRWVRDEDGIIRAHGERVLERLLADSGPMHNAVTVPPWLPSAEARLPPRTRRMG